LVRKLQCYAEFGGGFRNSRHQPVQSSSTYVCSVELLSTSAMLAFSFLDFSGIQNSPKCYAVAEALKMCF
jgi:hypothetical protein